MKTWQLKPLDTTGAQYNRTGKLYLKYLHTSFYFFLTGTTSSTFLDQQKKCWGWNIIYETAAVQKEIRPETDDETLRWEFPHFAQSRCIICTQFGSGGDLFFCRLLRFKVMTHCWTFSRSKNRNRGKGNPRSLHNICLVSQWLCIREVLSDRNIIRYTYCFSAGRPLNLKRICICSVIYQMMMQYTATIRFVTSPSSRAPKKRTCILCQIRDRTRPHSCLHIFLLHLLCCSYSKCRFFTRHKYAAAFWYSWPVNIKILWCLQCMDIQYKCTPTCSVFYRYILLLYIICKARNGVVGISCCVRSVTLLFASIFGTANLRPYLAFCTNDILTTIQGNQFADKIWLLFSWCVCHHQWITFNFDLERGEVWAMY